MPEVPMTRSACTIVIPCHLALSGEQGMGVVV
jgi:hypothetical protein